MADDPPKVVPMRRPAKPDQPGSFVSVLECNDCEGVEWVLRANGEVTCACCGLLSRFRHFDPEAMG